MIALLLAACTGAAPLGDSAGGTAADDTAPPLSQGPEQAPGDGESSWAEGTPRLDTGEPSRPPSFLFILTDDQSYSLAVVTPTIDERLLAHSVRFNQAVVNTPLCSPTRASLLSGGFHAHQTGVRVNDAPQGGMEAFDDSATLPTALQAAGWRTGFVGKYIGNLTGRDGYVPPGWDRMVATTVGEDWTSFTAVVSDHGAEGTEVPVEQYATDYIEDEAEAFLASVGDAPFFLMVAHFAPHQNSVPDEADQGTLSDRTWRPPNFNEVDVSDKPAHIQALEPVDTDEIDAIYQRQLEAMLSVDRSVGRLLDALEASGRDQDTVVVFLSDNGYSFGEHRLSLKGHPYEESIVVPAAVRVPGVEGRDVDTVISASVDLPATILELAGVDAPTAGRSLLPLLGGEVVDEGEWQLLQGIRIDACPDFVGVRTQSYAYLEYLTGEVELYDLASDPAQLVNRAGDAPMAVVQHELAEWVAAESPLFMVSRELEIPVGEDFEIELEARGGTPPYSWSIRSLPYGVFLDSEGLLFGRVETGGQLILDAMVTDSSVSPYDGDGQAHSSAIHLTATSGSPPTTRRRSPGP